MAKLVEILAKELGEWPANSTHCVQMVDHTSVKGLVSFTSGGAPAYYDGEWSICCDMADPGSYWERYEFQSDIATDHATAIVTREMWQAERNKQSCERVEEVAEIIRSDTAAFLDAVMALPGDDDPRTLRDRIREIDATIEAMTAERAELVSKLAGEGFALIVQTTEPIEDMGDPTNWKKGDLITFTKKTSDSFFTTGKQYIFEDLDGYGSAGILSDDEGDENGWDVEFFKWHSRPAA